MAEKLANRLLQALSAADRRRLEPHLRPVVLKVKDELEASGAEIKDIYFPETGVVSVIANSGHKLAAEIGLVGCEGMTGSPVLLGWTSSPHQSCVQIAGEGHAISTRALSAVMAQSTTLADTLRKYVHILLIQTSQTALANARGKLDARLARWLLMAHDRISKDEIALTHEFLALMLAVRRTGVTEAIQILEGEGMIRARRGRITIRDRGRLLAKAGRLYGVPEAEHRRLFP